MTKRRAHFGLRLHWMHLKPQKACEKFRNNEVTRNKGLGYAGVRLGNWCLKSSSFFSELISPRNYCLLLLPSVLLAMENSLSVWPSPAFSLDTHILTLPSCKFSVSYISTLLHIPLFILIPGALILLAFAKGMSFYRRKVLFLGNDPLSILLFVGRFLYGDIYWNVTFDASTCLPQELKLLSTRVVTHSSLSVRAQCSS